MQQSLHVAILSMSMSCPRPFLVHGHIQPCARVQHQYIRGIITLITAQNLGNLAPLTTYTLFKVMPSKGKSTNLKVGPKLSNVCMETLIEMVWQNEPDPPPSTPIIKAPSRQKRLVLWKNLLYGGKTSGWGAQGHCAYMMLWHAQPYTNPAGLCTHSWQTWQFKAHTDTWRQPLQMETSCTRKQNSNQMCVCRLYGLWPPKRVTTLPTCTANKRASQRGMQHGKLNSPLSPRPGGRHILSQQIVKYHFAVVPTRNSYFLTEVQQVLP